MSSASPQARADLHINGSWCAEIDSHNSHRNDGGHSPTLAGPEDGLGEGGAEDVSSRLSGEGTLIGTFIADQKHPFFAGNRFHAVLRAVQAQPRKFKVYEKGGTLRVSVQDVKNVREAKGALEGVVGANAQHA